MATMSLLRSIAKQCRAAHFPLEPVAAVRLGTGVVGWRGVHQRVIEGHTCPTGRNRSYLTACRRVQIYLDATRLPSVAKEIDVIDGVRSRPDPRGSWQVQSPGPSRSANPASGSRSGGWS